MPDIQVKTGYLKDEETNEIFLPRTDASLVTGLEDLATIRQKSNSAYQKPQSGIPASDLANGVIPDVSGKEDKTNKVTAISNSPTDTKYPSEKAVYDFVGDVVRDDDLVEFTDEELEEMWEDA